jgi:hypothetical protein
MLGIVVGNAVVGSGLLGETVGVEVGNAVVGSGVLGETVGVGVGNAVVGSGVRGPTLGTERGDAVVGSGVRDPMLGTVCGGGGHPCAEAEPATTTPVAAMRSRIAPIARVCVSLSRASIAEFLPVITVDPDRSTLPYALFTNARSASATLHPCAMQPRA